jgi:photosystem II stability/assembly factor-like uncharacterized protein
MKKIILLLLLIQQIVIGQDFSVFPNVPYSELHALAVEGDFIYTAGDCNTAIVSKNGGDTWTTIELDITARSICIVPGSNGEKAIYQNKDEILEFDINTLEFTEISTSSLFLSSGNYIRIESNEQNVYVISNQNVHVAQPGQYNWTRIADFGFQNDAVVATDITENYLHVGSLNGLLLRVDLSTTEVEEMNDFMSRIYSFDMVNDDLGYFTIQNFTYPIKTTDGGSTYSDLDELPENIGVKGYGENVIVTVNTNRIYVSTDGGASSTYIPIPDDGTYDLIYASLFTDDGVLYFAGRSSMVGKSTDFGASFINLNEYQRENLFDIEIHPSGKGVAIGGTQSIVKTDDGGDTWALQDLTGFPSDNYLNAVVVISQNKYLVAGNDILLVVVDDQIVENVAVGIDNMIYNSDGDYLVGLRSDFSDFSIVKSTDQGLTWESKAFLPSYNYHISQSPSGKIFVPGPEDNIYTSVDGGETWDIESFGSETEIRRLAFLDENVGIASTGLQLYMTTDGGETSSLISTGYDIKNLHFISADNIVYTTSNESQTNIYESTDGGNSFEELKEFCSQSSGSFRDEDNTIWLAQNGGHINKYIPAGSTSTNDLSNELLTLYPNPIHAGQDVKLDVDMSISEIVLTSISGKIIRKIKASHENSFSTNGMSSGMYSVTLKSTNGELVQSKLVIIE